MFVVSLSQHPVGATCSIVGHLLPSCGESRTRRKKQLLTRRILSPFSMMMAGIEEKEESGIQCNLIKSLYVGVDDDEQPGGSEDLHVDDDEHGKDDDCHTHTCS